MTLNPGTTPGGDVLNMFNLLGFPATAEDHYTAGFTYNFSDTFSVDGTVVYSPEAKTTANVSGIMGAGAQIINKHSEVGVSIQLNYKF